MKDCKEFEEALWEAAEGESPAPALEEHLRECESCQVSLRAAGEALRGFEILRRVSAPEPRPAVQATAGGTAGRARRVLALAPAVGVVVAALAFTLLVGRQQPKQTLVVRPSEAVRKPETRPQAIVIQPRTQAKPAQESTRVSVAAVIRNSPRHHHKHSRTFRPHKITPSLTAETPQPEVTSIARPEIEKPCQQFTVILQNRQERLDPAPSMNPAYCALPPQRRNLLEDPTFLAYPTNL